MTVLQAIRRATTGLERAGVDSPRLTAELLLAHVLALPRWRVQLEGARALERPERHAFRTLVLRRARREPVQHLIGSTGFCGLEIAVSPAALVPRPETETLAELAGAALARAGATPVALDFGTGTGCLALALATHCPTAIVHALDVSADALALARANAAQLRLATRVTFHLGDGFAALPPGLRFDLVVSNPPYIPSAEIADLQPEVRDFDPRLALDGGADGLDFYRRLARETPAWLRPGGGLFAEFGDGQEAALPDLFQTAGWRKPVVHPDLSGRPRVLEAWR